MKEGMGTWWGVAEGGRRGPDTPTGLGPGVAGREGPLGMLRWWY